MVPENLKKLWITTRFCGKFFFKNGQKYGFLNLKKNLFINFHGIYSILKIFICCYSCTNPLGKILPYRPKSSQNRLNFSMLIWQVWSLDSKIELTNGINLFFAFWYNFMKINLNVLGVGMVKNGCGMWWDFKIDCIWRMNRWNKLNFCMLLQIHKN